MRERDLRVRPRRRFVVTTDGDHDGPIFPDLTRDVVPTGPDQLWVADLTDIRVLTGFVCLAVIPGAWSRRVVGWALSPRIDADLAPAALEAAWHHSGQRKHQGVEVHSVTLQHRESGATTGGSGPAPAASKPATGRRCRARRPRSGSG